MTSKNPDTIKLIAGLGNPGPEYARTYHNAGALAVRSIGEKLGAGKPKSTSLYTYAKADRYTLVTPLSFMNESGDAVAAALRFFKYKPEELLVVHDDSDLPLGETKLQFGRGAAGHRGVLSIIEHLGTKDFWRLRIGIRLENKAGLPLPAGRQGPKRAKAGDFVLRPMSATDEAALYSSLGGFMANVIEKSTPSS